MNNLFSMFQNFMQNPIGMMMQSKINVPQNIANDPNAIMQYLMNSGQVNQGQYNQAMQRYRQMQGNPMFKQFFK